MVASDALKHKEVVVYGTGVNAVKCVRFLENNDIKIDYILDGRAGIGKFKDYPVYMPSDERLAGKYIVVACAGGTYEAIRERLHKYKEFKDYIYYNWLNKKMVYLHGNCHMDVIEACLDSSGKFRKEYAIYPAARVCMNQPINTDILEDMDIWIHEDIQKNNRFGYEFSDEYLGRFMTEDVVEIIMPHLYGLGGGFFPYAKEWNNKNTALLNGADRTSMFPRRDALIEQCLENNMGLEQICSYVQENDIVSGEYILENFNVYINKIQQREKYWDIKISDFILEHYRSEKLFYDDGHPTNVLLEKISADILQILGVPDNVSTDIRLDLNEIPVYPWIRKVLGMEWTEEYIRTSENAIKCNDYMDIEEYIREYIWWCYPERNGKKLESMKADEG